MDSLKNIKDLGCCAVTGGSGWLGTFLVSELASKDISVVILDIAKPKTALTEKYSNIIFKKCDITDFESLKNSLKGTTKPENTHSNSNSKFCG